MEEYPPHRTSIKAMELDKKHKVLATASLDKCVYIYRLCKIKWHTIKMNTLRQL